jgi:HK97 family phage prohead protease
MIYRGSVTGTASTMLTLQNSHFLARGTFSGTLPHELPLCYDHLKDHPIGRAWPREMNDDSIQVNGVFFLDDAQRRDAHILSLLKASMLRGLSVSFEIDDAEQTSPFGPQWIRRATLREVSLCLVGGNRNARVLAISFWPASPQEHQAFLQRRQQ